MVVLFCNGECGMVSEDCRSKGLAESCDDMDPCSNPGLGPVTEVVRGRCTAELLYW